MPKLKTHKGAAKRFKLTGTGNLGSPALVSEGDKRKVKRMIPYQ
jgi:ribosomal protein L35